MKKLFAFTFLMGAICGGGVTAFFFSGSDLKEAVPGEVKVLTRTEYRDVPVSTNSIQNDSREVTKYPEQTPEESPHDSDEVGKYDSPEEDESTQMEKFERSMASDQPSEEETPSENMYEPPPLEEPSEN